MLMMFLCQGRPQRSMISEVLPNERLQREGLTLNKDKCSFYQNRVTFLGHVIDKHGISQDPKKTSAIQQLPHPTNIRKLRRFMGMINHLNKFSMVSLLFQNCDPRKHVNLVQGLN